MDITMLKTHLGDELYAQVEEKLGALDGFQVIATNDGTWLPKSRLDAEIDRRKELQNTVNTLTKDLNAAKQKAEASDTLQQKIDQLTHDVEERDGTISGLRRSGKIRELLTKANARDAAVIEKLLDASKIGEDDKGNLTGVDEQIKALKETSAYLFNETSGQRGGFSGSRNPNTGNSSNNGNADVNAAIRAAAGIR